MTPESSTQYYDRCCKDAEAAFANHIIREMRDNGSRYFLCRKYPDGVWDTNMCCEVIVIRGGLFVGGDSPDCIFRWFSDSTNPKQVIGWMGGHQVDTYVFEKACIGIGRELAETIDPKVVLHDLKREIDEYENNNGEPMPEDLQSMIEVAMDQILSGCYVEGVFRKLNEYSPYFDGEFLSRIGRVPSVRVFAAHAAARRLWNLICAEGG